MKKRSGFTLVEILIVVVILGILAAIVIPQFSDASEDAKYSTLVSDLQTVRSQIQLYKLQHKGKLPPGMSATPNFIDAMTKFTTANGALAAVQAPADGVFGPYIQKVPKNQFNESSEISSGVASPAPGDDSSGWYYNVNTGAFNANDSAAHRDL
ncbi:MAG: prepilin-type N-terminal cleavage/methylation domain-containing protein [Sedimentisphaerales bacterium]|nr:prepilin-type N-terminal cleavage/methylation domain-containing protein [Sedimentisphaerales bacterium]